MSEGTRSLHGGYATSGIWHDSDDSGTSVGHARIRSEQADRAQALRALQGDAQVLYALRLTDGTIKIGCTSNLAQRHRSYPGAQILAFMPGDFEDEAAIHESLREYRARGWEYYHASPEVIAVVNAMRDEFGLPHLAA